VTSVSDQDLQANFEALALEVGEALRRRGQMLTTAESCTGGWVATVITSVPGSSEWFERGFVTYTDAAKIDLLGVDPATIEAHGAVSEATATAMAAGALAASRADVAVAVTGIAGPGGATADKPVGTVWLGWGIRGGAPFARHMQFSGERSSVRAQAVDAALRGLLDLLARV
jgi:nicotinamide-nucleotide amidase